MEISNSANVKGDAFEDEIENLLTQNNLKFERHKWLRGYGKRWLVDFYLPELETIIECKSVREKNILHSIQSDCLKFLDIRNKFFQMNFVLTLKHTITMDAFARFCTTYNIKLTTTTDLIKSLKMDAKTVNGTKHKLETPEKKVLKAVESFGSKGATKQELSEKTGYGKSYCTQICRKYKDKEIAFSKLTPRRFFTKNTYNNSNEQQLISELTQKPLKLDLYYVKKYGFSLEQVRRIRKEKLRLKKDKHLKWKDGRRSENCVSLTKFQ